MKWYQLLLMIFASFTITVTVIGCSEANFSQVDKAAEIAASAAQGGAAVLDSPAGSLIPAPIAGVARLGIEAVIGLAGLWFANKSRIKGAVLRSVVQAVDSPTDTKQAVKTNLKAANIEAAGRTLINKYKKAA